ncbi:phosphoglycerate kinase [Chitinispirillales bacterium ANBcel5]|uniref:phosphoglycerate kinase n=1 Tax=Cellulosispirillum alkaliphilum TaxID=3039283 RepID=UPI002A578FCB|nr:phosphoglycerate kinase [Chitinispirillales bacterium ANBcel5]
MAIKKKTVKDVDFKGKKVIMRVDFNVPMDKGEIQDDTRIQSALPTINYVLEQGAKSLVLMSHLGDPKKDTKKAKEKAEKEGNTFDEKAYLEAKHKMAPVAAHLSKLISKDVAVAPDCISDETKQMVAALDNGAVLMLENTRFHKEEKSKDDAEREKMASVLATYGDIYVNDAFGTAHRAHASTETIARHLPAVAGFLMEKELVFLQEKVVDSPEKPFLAIIGGAKVSSKISVLESLLSKVNNMIIGGGMAYTFLKAKGLAIGDSLVEDDMIDTARKILQKAYETNVYIYLPIDHIVTQEFGPDAEYKQVARGAIEEGWMGMDIGPLTREKFKNAIKGAKTIFWNGPMGVFEFPRFAEGTQAIATTLAEMDDAITVIGGGDSVSAVKKAGVADKMSHISTGGGASLELVEGKELPGVKALNDK